MEAELLLASGGGLRCSLRPSSGVAVLQLDRPSKSNAFDAALWQAFPDAVRMLQRRGDVRACVITAAGANFCAGLDLSFLAATLAKFASSPGAPPACPGRQRLEFRDSIQQMQEAFSVLEGCRFPVLAAVHGACVGAGVDLVTAADLRYCSADAAFSVKEADLAITADLGTLQRLPAIIGHGAAAELALTARSVDGREAARLGLVSRCYDSREELLAGASWASPSSWRPRARSRSPAPRPSCCTRGMPRVWLAA